MKYNLIIHLIGYDNITLPVEYENEYNLRRDVSNIGNGGVWQKKGEDYLFIPAHKITKIDIISNKD
jgi:hypothetical protein